jgi:hypothetical protein
MEQKLQTNLSSNVATTTGLAELIIALNKLSDSGAVVREDCTEGRYDESIATHAFPRALMHCKSSLGRGEDSLHHRRKI